MLFSMKKAIIFFLAAVFLPMAIRGQDSLGVELSPEFLAVMADTCRPPRLVAKSVINYEAYSRAYLEFEGTAEGQSFGYRLLVGTEGGQVSSINGEILIEGLLPDNLYEVTVVDNCGDEVVVAILSTFADNPSIRGIEVSDRMYKTIVAFQQQEGTVPLSQYLDEAEGVSPYEKVSFVQQYFFKGQKFETDAGPIPPPPPPPPTPTDDDCLCMFVFNTSQNALPGTLLPDGSILPSTDDSDGKIDLPGNAHWWWATYTKGAAKWNAVQSEGWKAGSDENTVSTEVINNINASPYVGQVSYNLLGTNYANLPRDCECDKPLKLYYRYDTEVLAYANRHTGGLSEKKSRAASQNIAVVTLRNGNADVEVLAAGDVRAEAECNWDVNSQFWVELIEVAGNIAVFFVNENSTQLPTLINNLATQLGQLVTTPFVAESGCDANATRTETLANGIIPDLIFHPNQAVYLDVFSFSNLMCGGKRSWFSWANVNSDFYAAGIVPGGFLGEGEDHCCTQKIGSWVLGSSEKPYTTDETKAALGFYFGTEGPWGMPNGPGNITKLTEWGWDAVVVEERCIVPVNPGSTGNGGGGLVGDETGSRSSAVETGESTKSDEAKFIVYDISGRTVFRGTSRFDKTDVIHQFMENAGDIPAGLYIIQLSDGLRKETVKVFYPR